MKDKPVSIVDSVKKDGYCFDYFNPNATAFLDDAFNNVNKAITGMWLYHNLPTVDSTTQEDSNPFADLLCGLEIAKVSLIQFLLLPNLTLTMIKPQVK